MSERASTAAEKISPSKTSLIKTTLGKDEGLSLTVIRGETALSRYPVHRLANKGIVSIDIRRKDAKGATTLAWEVTYNSKYGQPGPLAYKLDTLVINRRIDEAGRPVPKVLRLGSLREIADELDLGGDTNLLKRALRQNASAFITVKGIRFETVDKVERTLEADFTRYSVIFTGEKMPNGLKADAVYLILNDVYLDVLNSAKRRPLDYDYLRELPPAAQRFYEIVSYEMLPAIRFNQRAKLPYSEFCLYSTMTRYFDFDRVKKQMFKVHQSHVKAGYITRIEYEAIVDQEGRPDWNMFYVPGERAKFQQLVFSFDIPNLRRDRERALPHESITLPPNVSAQADGGAGELVRLFYRLRHGQPQEPTPKEVEQAALLIAEGREWADYLVSFAARQGKERAAFPDAFGGVMNLTPKARESYAVERGKTEQKRLSDARKRHQEAHWGAYEAFLGELLAGRLPETLPEAFAAFAADEEKVRRFHRGRAEKSERSATTLAEFDLTARRIARLIRFAEEHPEHGIPSFWQWDEKLNVHCFDASHL